MAILNHNTPSAYLVPSETFERLMDIADDYLLAKSSQRVGGVRQKCKKSVQEKANREAGKST